MSILVTSETRVLVQGITGREGRLHALRMREAGTRIVAGVTPGKGGDTVEGIPVFDSVAEAAQKTQADTSVIFVPAPFVFDAIMEAAESVRLVVVITEGAPVHDMVRARKLLERRGVTLIGPNCPGITDTSTGQNLGIMPAGIFAKGPVGVVSRSGTLTYEIVAGLTRSGLGETTCIGIGGDPVGGLGFVDVLRAFQNDPETKVVVLIGEIGGDDEEVAADFVAAHMTKPVIAYIAGFSAPPGRKMGHAGAIVSHGKGGARAKKAALEAAGVPVASTPAQVSELARKALAENASSG